MLAITWLVPGSVPSHAAASKETRSRRRDEARAIHQVAQDHPVRDAGEDAWPDQEGPVVDRDESLAESGVRDCALLP